MTGVCGYEHGPENERMRRNGDVKVLEDLASMFESRLDGAESPAHIVAPFHAWDLAGEESKSLSQPAPTGRNGKSG